MTVDMNQQLLALETRYANNPEDVAVVRDICETLLALKRENELLFWADRALALDPCNSGFIAIRAFTLNLLGRHVEAAEAWESDPLCASEPALHPLRCGYSLMMAGDLVRAVPLLEQARREAAPDNSALAAHAEHLMGEAMLKAGEPRGFSHWLMRNGDPGSAGSYCPTGIPVWSGETDLSGKRVLITHQLGFGDNFLLAACVTDWLEAGASVMMTCDPQILALMQATLPDCEVVSAPRPLGLCDALPDDIQAHVEAFAPHLYATLLHLPLLKAGQMARSEYRFQPYIHAPALKQRDAEAWALQVRTQHPGKMLVGLFWDCYQRHQPELNSSQRYWAARRSLPLDAVNWLVTNPDVANRVHFVNLHHPIVEAAAGTPVGNMSRYLPGIWHFDDTAACIAQLDAVIAVDSSVANLAAMIGIPTCVPVNTSGDWRWGSTGTTSPWISDVTVLRQTREGDWNSVVPNIAAWLLQRP
ncbi:hypothetical protein GQ57_10300 [Burkholderia sp. MSh2]|uniref:TPR domain-containing protein n=2 Tax=Burkholderiaceae TaxID=119060 RepID=A0A6P2I6I1_9BURK|nr:hypothetical protein GQ57_10300 [Burkholderia sp. MSh2]CAB3746315.1 hypothetical protein LMG30113_00163 [Burkholderia paludis]VWB24246.1 TPR domain-containing protein [Burkholderia paludis]